MKSGRTEPEPSLATPAPEGNVAARSSVPGSLEFKQALLKRCFWKMAMGVVMLSPIIMTQFQHRFGQSGSGLIVLVFLPIGTAFFVFACMDYAKSKGLHPAMGLLGLGSILGLMILSFWPDRYQYDKEAKRERKKVGKP